MALTKVIGSGLGAIPAISGANLTGLTDSQLPAGSIIQVKEGRLTSQFSTTSTSFTNTGLSLDITPTDNNNKILLTANFSFYHANAFAIATILRGSTNIGHSSAGLAQLHAAGGSQGSSASMHILDNPQTASEISYYCHMLVQSGTGYFNINTTPAILTAMEVVV